MKIAEDSDATITDICPMCTSENFAMAVSGFNKAKRYHFNCRYCGWWWKRNFEEVTSA